MEIDVKTENYKGGIRLKKALFQYGKNIFEDPKRVVIGILTGGVLLGLSLWLVDGGMKRILICMALSLGTGILILLPEWNERLNILFILLYFLYVPLKLFQRTELPFHDMSLLVDGVQTISIWMIICVYLLLFLVTQRVHLALGIGNIIFIILFLVEYYVCRFRGMALTPSDILAARTAAMVMQSYDYSIYGEGAYTVLYFIFFTAWGFRMKMTRKGDLIFHITLSVVSVITVGALFFLFTGTDWLEKRNIQGHYWDVQNNQTYNGTFLSFFVLWQESYRKLPWDYTTEELEEVASNVQKEYDSVPNGEMVKPNIIMIMNESWSDLRVLGEIETSEPFMPFTDSLEENAIKGHLYTPVLGGITANTEYEALTGDSLAVLAPTVVLPYLNQVNHDIYALPRTMHDKGYQTMAIHAGAKAAWNRGEVYEYFGFDEFFDANEFETTPEYLRGFVSDKSNFQEIIWRYEHRDKERPFFLFDVTIQNHGGYYPDASFTDLPIEVERINGTPAAGAGNISDLEMYLNLMKITDDDFKNLIHYFEQVEEPVVVCMFGDHQPLLSDNFYSLMFKDSELSEFEQNLIEHMTPYVIWTNYDINIEEKEYGDFSANYLPGVVMRTAGLDLPVYFQFLEEARLKLPVISVSGCIDKEGTAGLMEDWEDTEIIRDYRILQYGHLYDKGVPSWVFEG